MGALDPKPEPDTDMSTTGQEVQLLHLLITPTVVWELETVGLWNGHDRGPCGSPHFTAEETEARKPTLRCPSHSQ